MNTHQIQKTKIVCYISIQNYVIKKYYYQKRSLKIMQDENNTGRGKSFPTQQTEDDFVWEEQNQIFYFSNFSLFENEKDQNTFYEYSIFMEKISIELGKEWKMEADQLFKPYASSRQVFMNLLQIWLHHHPITNLQQNRRNSQFTFNQSYVEQFNKRMKQDIKRTYGQVNIKIQNVAVKAVCIGFFMTSNQIWEQMFQSESTFKSQDIFSNNTFIQGVTKTIQKTFKPVMVVSEKISSVFGKKKVKTNQQAPAKDCDHIKFENCYQQFQKTLDIQRQVQRKMSQINLDEFQQYESKENKKLITSKAFQQNQSPIQNKLLSSVYDYLTNFLKVNSPWQVANSFVTNILDMKYLKTEEGTRVKVLKPAQDFYQKLVFVWLLLKNQKQQVKFEEYLDAVKSKFNQIWQQKYIIPTKYFFQRINRDWHQIKSQATGDNNGNVNLNDKKILTSLLKRIRKGMKNQWDQKIKISTKRNWKSQSNLGKSSQFYHQSLKRERNFKDY